MFEEPAGALRPQHGGCGLSETRRQNFRRLGGRSYYNNLLLTHIWEGGLVQLEYVSSAEVPALLDYLSSVPHIQLPMLPVKKAKLDFLGQISKKFVGSGDPEVSDAQDVVTYLSKKYTPAEWKSLLMGLYQRLLSVTGATHPTAKSTVPDVSVGSTEDMWVMVWHLGHLEDHAYRGLRISP